MRSQIEDLHAKMDEMLVENERTEKVITEANVLKKKVINRPLIEKWKRDMGMNETHRGIFKKLY